MDFKVVWSPEAIEDIESIAQYISRDSEFYARAVVTKIIQMAQSIESFPWTGRVVPELENKGSDLFTVTGWCTSYRRPGFSLWR